MKAFEGNQVVVVTVFDMGMSLSWHIFLCADNIRCPITSSADWIESQIGWTFVHPTNNICGNRPSWTSNKHPTRRWMRKYSDIVTNWISFFIKINLKIKFWSSLGHTEICPGCNPAQRSRRSWPTCGRGRSWRRPWRWGSTSPTIGSHWWIHRIL